MRSGESGKLDKARKLEAGFAKEDQKSGSKMNILNQTLSELNQLENSSSQVYNLLINSNEVPSTADGVTTYDISSNAVNVSVKNGYDKGIFAHELKHAFQFQTGALSFGQTGRTGGFLYDLNDEYEAFSRGSFFGGKSLTKTEINTLYPNIPKGPLNLNTPSNSSSYGQQMRALTSRNAKFGTAQQQFYINWRNNE